MHLLTNINMCFWKYTLDTHFIVLFIETRSPTEHKRLLYKSYLLKVSYNYFDAIQFLVNRF